MGEMNRRTFLATAPSALLVGACSRVVDRRRYEIGVVLEGPEGKMVRTGVIGIASVEGRGLAEGRFHYGQVTGTAIPIHLSDGRILFMMLGYLLSGRLGGNGLQWSLPWWNSEDVDRLEAGRWVRFLDRALPAFAWFKDIKDSRSIEIVYSGYEDILNKTKYRLLGIFIRKTTKPIKDQVSGIIPWINSRDMDYLSNMMGSHDTYAADVKTYPKLYWFKSGKVI